ncbi:NAD-dependent epimerase/dehydratase family protein [Shewanella maritima]|uniref:NAD-dependent epimerase/dehydratase family protein n=1 Tax=Shewanella maritima TaxID=2520507 RepID=A0A411PDL0_9GAMM|nr:2-alkyl-3-oxoalkanoate reductase [Shewanella maritima]QBF81636.1 NAD-dependent epimerase/dehydratase family protein [Shewanella maritima]
MNALVLQNLTDIEQQVLTDLASRFKKVLVTGAGGFLGKAIALRLHCAGIEVVGLARGEYPQLSELGIDMRRGDISKLADVSNAAKDCDCVFHVASKAGVWGSKQSYFAPNVDGAANVIAACNEHNIQYLVYTSTPSVTFAGRDENGVNESEPYAETYLNHYGESKAVAEKMMLAASTDSLKVTALRPHLIWGPEDPHLVPRVIARAEAGRLKLVGKQDKLVDTIYVDNAALAHLQAALELTNQAKCAAKAYYLSNDEPITMADMLNRILACKQLPPVSKRVPAGLAFAVGSILESVYHALGKQDEPIMTRFVAKQLSTSHYFDISAAKADFDYQPIVSIDEGMRRLRQWLS